MMTLSKKALDMLEYNGYSFRNKNNQIVFHRSAAESIGHAIAVILTVIVVVFLLVIAPSIGIGALIVAMLIFIPVMSKAKGRSKLKLDLTTLELTFEEHEEKTKKRFADISAIYTHSKFVDEYSSAFKSTSKEYEVTIGLEVDKRQIPLFVLIADHPKPSREMNEVQGFLEQLLRKDKKTTH